MDTDGVVVHGVARSFALRDLLHVDIMVGVGILVLDGVYEGVGHNLGPPVGACTGQGCYGIDVLLVAHLPVVILAHLLAL